MRKNIALLFALLFTMSHAQSDSLHTYCATRVPLLGTAQGICTMGNYVYVAEGTSGIEYFNITNPWNPTWTCTYGTTQRFNDCFVDPFLDLLVPNMTVDIVQLDPTPCPGSAEWSYDHPSASYATGIGGNSAFVVVAEQSDGIFIWNQGMGTTMVYSTPSPAYCATVDNIYAYVGCGTGLFVYNCNDGSPVGSILCGRVNAICIEDSFAYVGNLNKMKILNISNPAAITQVDSFVMPATASIQGIAVDRNTYDDFVFCAAGNDGLQILDVYNRGAIERVGKYYDGTYCKDVCLNGQFIYTVMGSNLVVLKHYAIPHWDGWSFINDDATMWFGDGRIWPMWENFRDAFGQSVCEAGDGTKRPLALRYYHIIGRAEKYIWKGSCFGMSMTMMGFHDNFWRVSDARWNPTGVDYAYQIPINDTLKHLINSVHIYQYGSVQWNLWRNGHTLPSRIIDTWHDKYLDSLFTVGFAAQRAGGGWILHYVVPFRLLQSSEDEFTLDLYDPNLGIIPGTMEMDTTTEEIRYNGNPWTATNVGWIELSPVDVVYSRPLFFDYYLNTHHGAYAMCVCSDVTGRTIVYNGLGDSVGSNAAGVFNSDTTELGWIVFQDTVNFDNPVVLWLGSSAYASAKTTISANDTASACFISSDNSIIEFSIPNARAGDIYRFKMSSTPNLVETKVYAQTMMSASVNLNITGVMQILSSPLHNEAFSIRGLSLAIGETIFVTISDTADTNIRIQRRGGAKANQKYVVEFQQCDSLSPTVYDIHSTDSILFTSNETHRLRVVDWHSLPTTDVYLYKDIGSNGSIDSVLLISTTVGLAEQCITPQIAFYGNFPNPFNSATRIAYNIPDFGHAKLEIVDIAGRVVAVLLDGRGEPGIHFATWDATGAPSGIYFARLTTSRGISIHRMALIR